MDFFSAFQKFEDSNLVRKKTSIGITTEMAYFIFIGIFMLKNVSLVIM